MTDIVRTTKRKKINRYTLANWAWSYFFIAPVFLGILVFSLGPAVSSLYMSMTIWNGIAVPQFIGLGNFVRLLNDPMIVRELKNTFTYALWTVPIALAISILVAVLLNSKIKGKSFFRVMFFLPVVTMPVAVASVWRYLFNSEYGLVNIFLRPFGLNPQWLGDPDFIMSALIIVAIWSGIGYSVIVLMAGLQGIPKTYYEAAEIDGASPGHQFFRLTVPLLSPTIFFLFVTSMMGALRAFDLIFMFSAAGQGTDAPTTMAIKTMVYGIYQRGFTLWDMGYASAEALVLFLIIMAITLFQFALQKHVVFYD